MIHPNALGGKRTAADNATIRSVFVVGPDKKVKLVLTYPMTTGRNFDEVLRVLDSMIGLPQPVTKDVDALVVVVVGVRPVLPSIRRERGAGKCGDECHGERADQRHTNAHGEPPVRGSIAPLRRADRSRSGVAEAGENRTHRSRG